MLVKKLLTLELCGVQRIKPSRGVQRIKPSRSVNAVGFLLAYLRDRDAWGTWPIGNSHTFAAQVRIDDAPPCNTTCGQRNAPHNDVGQAIDVRRSGDGRICLRGCHPAAVCLWVNGNN